MATWKEYVDFVKSKGNILDFMIVAGDTGALWAGTNEFNLREYSAPIIQDVGIFYNFNTK